MGPGAHGLRGATAAGRVVVVCRPPVGTATAPGQPSGPSPNSEATHSIHHPRPHLSPLSPAPSRPTIGGKYCLGERRRHRSCNTDVSSPWCCPSCPSLLPPPPRHPTTPSPPSQHLPVILSSNCFQHGCQLPPLTLLQIQFSVFPFTAQLPPEPRPYCSLSSVKTCMSVLSQASILLKPILSVPPHHSCPLELATGSSLNVRVPSG